ncbi:hypothetical protein [Citricoccus sp. GCM10030269]|uniref:hypothetical protein n=1 Tax=Citricoccus sp. GCM10030269 TaxID=3273388 RepID=UPI003622999A
MSNSAGETPNTSPHEQQPDGGAAPEPAASGGAYRIVALILAVIVVAALAYGLIDTGIKASALFTL